MPLATTRATAMSNETPPDADDSLTTTTRVYKDILDLAHNVCTHRKGANKKRLKLTEYLDSILRPVIAADHEAVMDEIADSRRKSRKKPPDQT